jgi:dTMP kinase
MLLGGLLVVLEGLDGAGKTTVALEIVNMLISMGYRALYTYEPFDSPFAQALSKVKSELSLSPLLDALAMTCDRAYHVETIVIPHLERGYIVVMDRYFYSTIAYQGAMGVDIEWLRILNSVFVKPDLAIYLDIEPEEGLKRSSARKWAFYEKPEILRKAREIYLEMVKRSELILVNSMRPKEEVIEDVWRHVERLLLRKL